MPNENKLLYQIAITQIPLVGAITAKTLISYCGSAEAVFNENKKALLKIPGIGRKIVESIDSKHIFSIAEKELAFIIKNDIKAFFYTEKNYPARLKHIHNAPILLYFKGNADLNAPRIIGIVGTRKPTQRGKLTCQSIIEDLIPYQPLIISGLAYGIDATAHNYCCSKNLPNLGVMANGLDSVYPAVHNRLASQMLENGGLLTEYLSNTKPDREHFPMRNRIIAGMCDAIIVIETARRGGSMITAEMGNQYNKDVFAVPGRLQDEHSQGCNHLIKTHKAALIESGEDVAYIMRWEALDEKKAIQQTLFAELSENEQQIINLLKKHDQIGVDTLCAIMSKPPSEMASLLLGLEFQGLISSLPGKRYILI